METNGTLNKEQCTGLKGFQPGAFPFQQRNFMVYVRTLQFMNTRLKNNDLAVGVHINQKFIEETFFKYPQFKRQEELQALQDAGELLITEGASQATGKTLKLYHAVNPGKWQIDLYLYKRLHPNSKPIGEQSAIMRSNLLRVSLPQGAPSTNYFDAFLKFRFDLLELFFTTDDFAGRVHTPVTNFHRQYRANILLDNECTAGLDVTTMQPLILGKVLQEHIPGNQYSKWIEEGRDIYVMLQEAAGLQTRDEGKKRFFEIAFAPPSNALAEMFGTADWITWINEYKRSEVNENPHKYKRHSNLAWKLQTTEVKIMQKVWKALNDAGIVFLSVHDEVIVKQSERHIAESLFRRVLDSEFTFYKLNVKEAVLSDLVPKCTNIPDTGEAQPKATVCTEIRQIITHQFTHRLTPEVWLSPGKTEAEILNDLEILTDDCRINYGLEVTPDEYYQALKNWQA